MNTVNERAIKFAAEVDSLFTQHNVLAHCTTHHALAQGGIAWLDVKPEAEVNALQVADNSRVVATWIGTRFYPALLPAEIILDFDLIDEPSPGKAALGLINHISDAWNFTMHQSAKVVAVDRKNKFTVSNLLALLDRYPSADTIVLSSDLIGTLLEDDGFAEYFCPVEKHALLETGRFGNIRVPVPANADSSWKEATRDVEIFTDVMLATKLWGSGYACLYTKAASHLYTVTEPVVWDLGGTRPQLLLRKTFGLAVESKPDHVLWFPPQR